MSKGDTGRRTRAVIDFLTDTVRVLPGTEGPIPVLDTKRGILYFANDKGVFSCDLAADPLATPSGATLTDVSPSDHPWHKGLRFAWKFLNGANEWEGRAALPCGRSGRAEARPSLETSQVAIHGLGAKVRLALTHRNAEGAALSESRTADFLPPDEVGGYAILSEHEFTALKAGEKLRFRYAIQVKGAKTP